MDRDVVIGCILVVTALGLISYLTFWSRRTIERIARSGPRSVRQIVKEQNGGR